MLFKKVIGLTALFCLLASGALACNVISDDWIIDFRDPLFSGAQDLPSFTVPLSGFELTIEAGVFPLGDALLWWDKWDGFGVQYSYERDEIEGPEFLQLSFSVPFVLEKVYIRDLFREFGYNEIGYYELNGSGDWIEFIAADDQLIRSTPGELDLIIGETVDFIRFAAPGLLQNFQNHEFAVAGIDGAPVPIPAPFVLLGSGIIGLIGLRRKLRRNRN